MDGLQSQLHPDRFDLVDLIEQCEDICSQTIRSGGNGENLHLRISNGFHIKGTKSFHRRISVRKCLKIGNIRVHRTFGRNICFSLSYLFGDGKSGRAGKIAGTLGTAEDAAPCSDMTVTVWTGHAAV